MRLFIGSSSYDEIPKEYKIDCKTYIDRLFEDDNSLVFGACDRGLMGVSYTSAKEHNRKILAISPKFYIDDLNKLDGVEKKITETVHDRNEKLIENADAIIFIPGGIGTVYEIFAAIETKRGGEFDKPIVIYNSCGFYDTLIEFLNKLHEEKFISSEVKKMYYVSNSAEDTLEYISKYATIDK